MVTTAKYRKLEMKYKKEKSTAKRIHFFLKFNFLDTLRNPVPPYPLLFRFNFIFILFFLSLFFVSFFLCPILQGLRIVVISNPSGTGKNGFSCL